MARNKGSVPTAIVVEEDAEERCLVTTLLEESEFATVECQSGEAALATMQARGREVAFMFADQCLAGRMDGVDLVLEAKKQWPELVVVLSSAQGDRRIGDLPDDILILAKPWAALDVLVIAEQAKIAVANMTDR
jgi:DNA-binding NtrC family response regulator